MMRVNIRIMLVLLLVVVVTLTIYLKKLTNAKDGGIREDLASMGAMRPADFDRLNQLDSNIEASHSISDRDLNWAIGLVRRGPISNTRKAHGYLEATVLFDILELHNYRGKQAAALNSLGMLLVNSPLWEDRMWSVEIFQCTHDKAARPLITKMTHDENPEVAQAAAFVLGKR